MSNPKRILSIIGVILILPSVVALIPLIAIPAQWSQIVGTSYNFELSSWAQFLLIVITVGIVMLCIAKVLDSPK